MPDGQRRTQPKILLLCNENPSWPEADLLNSQAMLRALRAALTERGHPSESYVYFDALDGLSRYDPHEWLVWNWGEELAGQAWTEAEVAEALEQRGFIYTGSGPGVFRLVQDRAAVKAQLEKANLPTLPWRVFHTPAAAPEWTAFPAIVKGANQHASYGIDDRSVVTGPAALAERIAYIRAQFDDDALVEPFLDSREFHVGVWGNHSPQALWPVELDYAGFEDMHDRLYTYEWKFNPASRGYREIKMPCPAPLDRPDWQARLMEVATAAYRAIGLRDYGRVDLRMLGDEPQILDVNANPDLDQQSVLPLAARAMGLSYEETLDRIIGCAAERMAQKTC